MLEIRTFFSPYKLKISRREPVTLSVEIANVGNEAEMVSFGLNLGNHLSLEKSGFKSASSSKIPEFKPGEKQKYYFDIWPKQLLKVGEQAIQLMATEHYQNFNYVKKKYDRMLTLTVEE